MNSSYIAGEFAYRRREGLVQCYKCQEIGHTAYACTKTSLQLGLVSLFTTNRASHRYRHSSCSCLVSYYAQIPRRHD